MTVSFFNAAIRLHQPSVVLFCLAGAAVLACAAAALIRLLNEHFSLRPPRPGRLWAAASVAACALFVHRALSPFYPVWLFGVPFWPRRLGLLACLRHGAGLAGWGALAVWLASKDGLAGRLERWLPRPSLAWPRLAAAGAVLGLSWGVFGAAANRGLFQIEAVFRMGRPNSGALLAMTLVLLLPACAALAVYVTLFSKEELPRRAVAAAGLMLLWILPVSAFEEYLRYSWDYGAAGLAEAAGLPPVSQARGVAVAVLSTPDGKPGIQRRRTRLIAERINVSVESLDRIRAYLETRGSHTLFARQALEALRRGWTLNWSPEDYMDAAVMEIGPFPPDYLGFLKTMCSVPATDEHYARLQRVERRAWDYRVPDVKQAQHTYEGFSAAYARFGDLERSNAWLDRIQKLFPLVEDAIRVEPLEEHHNGRIAGSVFFEGRPATAVKVGLFVLPSTTSVAGATEGLGALAVPDSYGRFEFSDLVPGRYYLALQADPELFSDDVVFNGPPGVFRLRYGAMSADVEPVQIERRVPLETEVGANRK